MTWFETLTGFGETSPSYVRQNLIVDGDTLTSRANGKVMVYGRLETPSLAELRERVRSVVPDGGRMTVREVVANVQALHTDTANADSLFQVASQFNLLEMTGPGVTPEAGVGIYENDHTQGPACAVAAGAGTIYRNYFAPVNGQIGQTESNQIDCLADLGSALGNTDSRLWQMRNGYALPSRSGLMEIANRLQAAGEDQLDQLQQLLRIGIQWHTQVTRQECTHKVSQVYCSALPVAYVSHPQELWEPFARLVLEAAYEATLCVAILNWRNTGNHHVFLTLLGGGVFGNNPDWVAESLTRALNRYQDWNLDVAIVSYGRSSEHVQQIVNRFL
ncbi:hypothetical protein GC175_11855 [bacterium]|nr:hypothetical protein [bacterium]